MNGLKKVLSLKWIAVWSVIVYAVSLIPIFAASVYAFPQADDWSYSWRTRLAWMDTHSLTEVLKGAFGAVAEAYVDWQGTFSSIFLMSLAARDMGRTILCRSPLSYDGTAYLCDTFCPHVCIERNRA